MKEDKDELFWVKPVKPVVDVWRRPLKDTTNLTSAARRRNIQTQAVRDSLPCKVLREQDGMYLIQMADLTHGYVSRDDVEKVESADYWNSVKRFSDKIAEVSITPEFFLNFIKNYPAITYVWGGCSENGRDCSALVQDVFHKTTGYLLPRNSKDQARLGQAVSELEIGDIVYLRSKEDGVGHIGIVVDACRGKVFHLSRKKGVPDIEELSQVEKRYKIIDIRRLIKFND